MSKRRELGDCIEGEGVELIGGVIDTGLLPKNNETGETLYRFTVERRASAEITKELRDKSRVIDKRSCLCVGDVITGKKLRGYCLEDLDEPDVMHGTSSHRIQVLLTSDHTFAKIQLTIFM